MSFRSVFSSLRFRLILLTLFAILPALLITLVTNLEEHKIAYSNIKKDAYRISQLVFSNHSQLIEEIRHVLYSLSLLKEVRNHEKDSCSELFGQLIKEHKYLINIVAADFRGDVFASAFPMPKSVNISDRLYFKHARDNKVFSIGDYQIGRIVNKPIMTFGYPILDNSGKVNGVVVAALDLDNLNKICAKMALPEDSEICVVSQSGLILARYPETGKWLGTIHPDFDTLKHFLSKENDLIELTGLDGKRRLYAVYLFSGPQNSGNIYLSVGFLVESVFSRVDEVFRKSLAIMIIIGGLAMIAAIIGGNFLVFRNLDPLMRVVRRIGSGDMSVRTSLTSGPGEFVQLSKAFDEMADSLEKKLIEEKQTREELKKSEERFKELCNLLPDAVFETDLYGNITFANLYAFKLFGYAPEELNKGLNAFQLVIEEEVERATESFEKALVGERSRDEFNLRKKDGTVFPAIIQAAPIIRDGKVSGLRGVAVDITEHRRSEEELRKAFAELSAIYNSTPILMVLVDRERRIKKVNRSFVEVSKRSSDEVDRLRFGDALRCINSLNNPEGCGFGSGCGDCEVRKVVLDTFENGRDYSDVEAKISFLIDEKKEERWFLANTSLIKIGNSENVLVCLEDITRRKIVEKELRENMEVLKTFINSNPETMLLIDEKGTVLIANETFSKRIGRKLEETIGCCLYDMLPEDVARLRRSYFEEVIKTGSPVYFEDKRSDRIYANYVYPVYDCDGRKVSSVSILGIDITEKKKMEENLRKSEQRFRELFNNAPIGYHEYDTEGRIVEVNQTELEMLGYTKGEMIGHFVWEFIVEEMSKSSVLGKLAGTIPIGNTFERTYRKKDGTYLPVMIMDRALRDQDGRIIGIRSALQDITKLKEIQKEKEILEAQFRQSQKMEAIGRLAGGIAHDFNNLLTVIKGYSQLSLLGLRDDDPLKESLNEIQKATDKASNLTRQLLAFSRKQIMEMRILDLNTILHDLEKMLKRIIGEDIEFILNLSDNLWKIKSDRAQIEQMIMNLVVNSRDAMPKGGRLIIETANVELDDGYAKSHLCVEPGSYVMLSVSDTGIGMTQEVKERIFEPFFTTKGREKGTGLGLSTVYGIVKQSGGDIWVYSEPGHGTTFKIYLPKVDEVEEFVKSENKEEIPGGNETILVIEDDDSVRNLACKILEKQGYQVFSVADEVGALNFLENHKNRIHLVLTDVIMPGRNGPELIEELRCLRDDFKVLYMSGHADDTIVNHGVLKKGINFIHKPFTFDGLAKKVREVLDT